MIKLVFVNRFVLEIIEEFVLSILKIISDRISRICPWIISLWCKCVIKFLKLSKFLSFGLFSVKFLNKFIVDLYSVFNISIKYLSNSLTARPTSESSPQ